MLTGGNDQCCFYGFTQTIFFNATILKAIRLRRALIGDEIFQQQPLKVPVTVYPLTHGLFVSRLWIICTLIVPCGCLSKL